MTRQRGCDGPLALFRPLKHEFAGMACLGDDVEKGAGASMARPMTRFCPRYILHIAGAEKCRELEDETMTLRSYRNTSCEPNTWPPGLFFYLEMVPIRVLDRSDWYCMRRWVRHCMR